MIHGASDGWPGRFVEKLGDFLLSQSESPLGAKQQRRIVPARQNFSSRGAYHKTLVPPDPSRHHDRSVAATRLGEAAPERFEILENGLRYEMSFNEGYSVGLFFDQRDNRRRLLTGHIAAGFPLSNSRLRSANS